MLRAIHKVQFVSNCFLALYSSILDLKETMTYVKYVIIFSVQYYGVQDRVVWCINTLVFIIYLFCFVFCTFCFTPLIPQ